MYRPLLGLAIGDMAPQSRVVAPHLQAVRVVLTVLHRGVGMRALGAAQLDHDAIALLAGHGRNSSDIVTRVREPNQTKRCADSYCTRGAPKKQTARRHGAPRQDCAAMGVRTGSFG